MRAAALVCLCAFLCGCGHTATKKPARATHTVIPRCLQRDPTATYCTDGPAPTITPGGPAPRGPDAMAGERVLTRAGCLACHRIGAGGNDGPGPDLSHIGRLLSKAQLRRVLLDPEPPMPSYQSLPRKQRTQLVAYLHQLR